MFLLVTILQNLIINYNYEKHENTKKNLKALFVKILCFLWLKNKAKSMNQKKIIPRFKIKKIIKKIKNEKKTIVFTNGCFDILHAGHVKYLEKAAQYGDILVLGLNSDKSVKNIKGDKRPINKENLRTCVVAGLFCIDYIVLFDEPDPMSLIKEIEPNVLVKGADWTIENIIGSDFVRQRGGIVKTVNLEPDISTTIIINKIVEKYGK